MSGPERIGDVTRRVLPSAEGVPAGLEATVRAWPAAVGDAVAREAWPVRLASDGTLLVHCRASVWASDLSHRSLELLRALERHGVAPPSRLRFVVGPVPERLPQTAPAARAPAVPDAAKATAAGIAASVREPRLRALIERAAAHSLGRAGSAREEGPDDR